jgi:hypothetical protein
MWQTQNLGTAKRQLCQKISCPELLYGVELQKDRQLLLR